MPTHLFSSVSLAVLLAAAGSSTKTEAPVLNPLLPKWTAPHGGVPPFDKVKVELSKSSLEAAMAEQLAEIDTIANDPAAPTFENTIAALERAWRAYDRVSNLYG